MCVITNTTAVVIRDFEHAKRTYLNVINLNIGYFTFLYTKCNGRVVITLTFEDRSWKRVYTMWEWDRYDGTRGLMLCIVALTPLCKNNSKETVYTDMNSEQDSHRLLITMAHVLSHASSYGICVGQSGTATAFSLGTSDSDVTDILSNGQRS